MAYDILGFGLAGPSLSDLERRLLRESPPVAVVLFARNVADLEQLRALVAEIKSVATRAPLLMIDEEGGRVDRLRTLLPGMPSAEAIGRSERAVELAGWMGTVYGMALRFLDVEVDLAPVVDVTPGVAPKGLETRAFGSDAETVTALAGAFLRGLHAGGAAGCLKHWPGIGAGGGDPHYGPTVIDAPVETLEARDLAPFRRLGAEAGAIMMGHGVYPALDDPGFPASLSRKIATDLLRHSLGFEGLAVSDDMEMHAVSDLASYEEIAARALLAGNDAILFCSQIERMPDLIGALQSRIEASPELQARLDEARRRGEAYRAHCSRIRDAVRPVDSWQAVLDEAGRFARAFDGAGAGLSADLGTTRGPTGREEWT